MKQNFKKYKSYLPKPKNQKILDNYWNFIKSHVHDNFMQDDYIEVHHCVPRAYLKTKEEINDQENLIMLRGKDHYIAHLLLWLAFHDKSSTFAFFSMNCFKRETSWKINSLLYENLRRENSKYLSKIQIGKSGCNKGRTYMTNLTTNEHRLVKPEDINEYIASGWIEKGPDVPEYQKQWLSEHYKGKNNPACKHVCKDETKRKMSESMSNLVWVNDGSVSKRVPKEELNAYLEMGFCNGRCKYEIKNPFDFKGSNSATFGSRWVTDGKSNKFIPKGEIEQFLVDNPEFRLGMTDYRNHKSSKRVYKSGAHWYNDGIRNYFLNDIEYDRLSDKIALFIGRYQFNENQKNGSKRF